MKFLPNIISFGLNNQVWLVSGFPFLMALLQNKNLPTPSGFYSLFSCLCLYWRNKENLWESSFTSKSLPTSSLQKSFSPFLTQMVSWDCTSWSYIPHSFAHLMPHNGKLFARNFVGKVMKCGHLGPWTQRQ